MTHENLYGIQISVSVSKELLEPGHIYSFLSSPHWFCLTIAELSISDRDHLVPKPKYLLSNPLQKEFVNPWVRQCLHPVKSEYQDLRCPPIILMLGKVTAESLSLDQWLSSSGRTSPQGDIQKRVGITSVVTIMGISWVLRGQGLRIWNTQQPMAQTDTKLSCPKHQWHIH